jgi:hypothetical protein
MNSWRIVSWPVLLMALSAPMLMDCGGKMPGGMPGGVPSVPGVPGVAGGCPDMANVDAIANFDWAKEFQLDAKVAGQLKAGVTAAASLKAISVQIDGDLKAACGGIAKDLTGKGDFATGEEACKVAVKAMGDARAKLGAKFAAKLEMQAPKCSASVDAMAECVGKCDVSVQGGKAEVKCEGGKVSGTCEAKCSGACEMNAAATCEGKCEGSCVATVKGACAGTCDGKCDGKDSKGECKGTCDGSCDVMAKGECKGKCGGTCELKGSAKCDGTCTGKCSAEMKAPKCEGKFEPPKASADCNASCDAKLSAKLECRPAKVALKVSGEADKDLALKYKAAIEKNLPGILKVAIGMKDRAEGVAGSVKGVVEGVQGTVQVVAKGNPMIGAKLTACVAAPFKGAIDAAASVKASVNVSVEVKASASASGSAKAG